MANDIVMTGPARLAAQVGRSVRRTFNRLGVVSVVDGGNRVQKVRDQKLDLYDKYYTSSQYDGLTDWERSLDPQGEYVPIRKRKPRINYPFAKVLSNRVASKLVGSSTFPTFKIEDDPETEDFIRAVIQASRIKSRILAPICKMVCSGSVFVRFFIVGGSIRLENYNAKHCYPEFLPSGELSSVMVRYVYEDKDDIDEMGKPKKKWFRLDVGMFRDVLYDNPEYKDNVEPIFSVVDSVDHNLGFVQGEWFKTGEMVDSPDGPSLIAGVLDFIDELNYSISQSSQAVSYNQDPQLTFNGMDEEDVNMFIRSATKGWNLGKEGKAEFLESGLEGVKTAMDLRDKVRMSIQDVARIVMLDPEKIVGSAQSAKAMEVLHGPLVELVNELRPFVEEPLIKIIQKMGLTILVGARHGVPVPIVVPPSYKPKSYNLTASWPPIFPLTTQDLKDRVSWVSSATSANLVSRETGTKILAKDFGIEDVEEELDKINSQPILNPFGSF